MSAAPRAPGASALLRQLEAWAEQGVIRRLDSAFAAFMVELCPEAPAPVVLAAAWLAHFEGRGHSCLRLEDLLDELAEEEPQDLFDEPPASAAGAAGDLLGWPAAANAELRRVLRGMPRSAASWLALLRSSPLVATAAAAGSGAGDSPAPLVLSGQRLYLRRYWAFENQVAAQVRQRTGRPAAEVLPSGLVLALPAGGSSRQAAEARRWLDHLFPAATGNGSSGAFVDNGVAVASAGKTDVDWQKVACAVVLRGRLTVITGGPGTGKTHTAARLLAWLFAIDPAPQRLRVALAAPTGKAAARLGQSIGEALQRLAPKAAAVGTGADGPATAESPWWPCLGRIGAARTLHSLLGARPGTRKFSADAAHPLPLDVLVVDEASMIHLEMMAALLQALPSAARVILLGDKDQLASVEAGAVLGDLCHSAAAVGGYRPDTAAFIEAVSGQRLPRAALSGAGSALAQQTVVLRRSRRYGGPIGQLAEAADRGDAARAASLLQREDGTALRWLDVDTAAAIVPLALHGRPGAAGGYAGPGSYLQRLRQRPTPGLADAGWATDDRDPDRDRDRDRVAFDDWIRSVLLAFDGFRLLCAVRAGAWGAEGVNGAVERALVAQGHLARRGEWYEGRPVMVTRNDPDLGVFNGDIGIVLRPRLGATAGLRAWFLSGGPVRSVAVSRLAHVETAFALTVHKSQGSEFAHTVLVLPPEPNRAATRELVYTGITRAQTAFTLVTGRRAALADALAQRTRRSSGLRALLEGDVDGSGDPGG